MAYICLGVIGVKMKKIGKEEQKINHNLCGKKIKQFARVKDNHLPSFYPQMQSTGKLLAL